MRLVDCEVLQVGRLFYSLSLFVSKIYIALAKAMYNDDDDEFL